MSVSIHRAQELARGLVRGSIIEDAAARFLAQCLEFAHAERVQPLREYLSETSGRLRQIADEGQFLTPEDIRRLADDMARVADHEDDQTEQ